MKTTTINKLCFAGFMFFGTAIFAQQPGSDQPDSQATLKSIEIMDDAARPLNPESSILEFKVFPNPANCLINIQLGLDPNVKSELKLFNPHWQEVYSIDATGSTYLTIDVTGFAEGVYFVRLTTAKNEVQIKKVNILP